MEEEKCESCGIGIGGTEELYTSEYREHKICGWCLNQWGYREQLAGREISWEEFKSGKLAK